MEKTFKTIIKESILNIDRKYFKQDTIIVGDKKKYNERVFCYELYHQLRLREKDFKDLTISGEAVKSNKQFNEISRTITPDLLIHNFGTVANNEVIIEVKTSMSGDKGLKNVKKDFDTLSMFTQEPMNYKSGIFILINVDFFKIDFKKEIGRKIQTDIRQNKRLEVWNIPTLEFNDNNLLKEEALLIYSNKELIKKIRETYNQV